MTAAATILTVLAALTLAGNVGTARALARIELRHIAATQRRLRAAWRLGVVPAIAAHQARLAASHRRLRYLRRVGLHTIKPIRERERIPQ